MIEMLDGERGAVAVLVALLILPLMLLLAFAVDTGNWWTHKRHLQTQADAGALAAGLGPWLPGCDEAGIENAARQYGSNLGAGLNPQYTNSSNVHVLLNSRDYYPNGSDFSDGGTPCQTLSSQNGFVDVKVTESSLSNLFGSIPGFSSVTVHAHARVSIQALKEESGVRPLAVRDDAAYQCAQVHLYRANADGSVGTEYTPYSPITLATRTTHTPNAADPTSYTQFAGSSTLTMPNPAQSLLVRVQFYAAQQAGACTGGNDTFPQDSSGNPAGGLNFIQVNANATAAAAQPPKADGVTVLSGSCSPDGYFSSLFAYPTDPDPCAATVKAFVSFSPGAITSGAGKNAFVKIDDSNTGASTDAAVQGDGSWQAAFSIAGESLAHQYTIEWAQTYGTVTGFGTCKVPNNGNPFSNQNPCHGTISGVQQQAFAGSQDSTLSSNTGSIVLMQIGEGASTSGANSFVQGTTHTLSFTVRVGGLANSRPTDPPIIIRYNVQSSKRTGVVDCGQGNGASAQYTVIRNGCPRPIYLWQAGDCGPPPPNAAPDNTPAGAPIDCVGVVPGNKRGQIKQAFQDKIGTSCDHWIAWKQSNGTLANFPPVGDPRVISMIITPPADLSGNGGSNTDIPVVQVASFYITGGDGLSTPAGGSSCANESYPGKGSSNGAIWGHFIKYVPPGGSGNGTGCNPNQFGDCVAVLTQ